MRSLLARSGIRGEYIVVVGSTGVASASSLFLGKVTAVVGGPEGVGLLGGFLGAISISQAVIGLGIPVATPAMVGPIATRRSTQIKIIVLVALISAVAISLSISPLVRSHLSDLFGMELQLFDTVGLAAAVVGVVLVATFGGVYATTVSIGRSALLVSTATSTGLVMASVIVWQKGIPSIPIALGVSALPGIALATVAAVRFLAKPPNYSASQSVACQRSSLVRVATQSVKTWIAYFPSAVTWALYPTLAIALMGASEAGFLKAGLSIGAVIYAGGYALVRGVVYPRSARIASRDMLNGRKDARHDWTFERYLAASSIVVALLSPVALVVFFSADFLAAVPVTMVLVVVAAIRVSIQYRLAHLYSRFAFYVQFRIEWTFVILALLGVVTMWLWAGSAAVASLALLVATGASWFVAVVLSSRLKSDLENDATSA